MPKPEWYPQLRVRALWNNVVDEPQFKLGFAERGRNWYAGAPRLLLPFDTSNTEIYKRAAQLVALVNLREDLHFVATFNKQYLYGDLSRAKREHYSYTPPAQYEQFGYRHYRTNPDAPQDPARVRMDEWVSEYDKRQRAKEKALELLTELTSPEFSAQVAEDHPFYFNTPLHSYIIDPSGKNVIRLDEKYPVGLCIYLADPAVQSNVYDWAIGVYLYLTGAEGYLHETANEYRYLRWADWRKVTVTKEEVQALQTSRAGISEGLVV